MRIAVVTSSNAAGMSVDDPILIAALERAGHEVLHWRWDDSTVDWNTLDIALIRSTWDYFTRMDEFIPWLEATRSKVRFVNDIGTLLWNVDKHYLVELADAKLPVLPTTIADYDGLADAAEAVWAEQSSVIIKPVVSGGSWGLHHLQAGEAINVDPNQGPWLVQPFVPSIAELGELSVIVLGGIVSHGIRKVPQTGDIRVQREHGGLETVEVPSDAACQVAHAIIDACPGHPTYARIDMVERAGKLELMEAELIEPELFFALVPEAADRLAAHIK